MTQSSSPMTFIVHAQVGDQNIRAALGKAEYSYYFLLKAFLPALHACGEVLTVTSPHEEVDALYDQRSAAGERCLFISFTPPSLAPLGLRCPTLCLFAWEFDTLPDGRWTTDPAQNWAWALTQHTGAIVCSQHTADVVRRALGDDYPVTSLAAPVWDRFAAFYSPASELPARNTSPLSLSVRGYVYDSAEIAFEVNNLFPALFRRYERQAPPSRLPAAAPAKPEREPPSERPPERSADEVKATDLLLNGTIYTSVFNPVDGRKAWYDIVTAFCIAFRDREDAVLVLKMTHTDPDSYRHNLHHVLHQLTPFKCRVVAFNGYLEADAFADLIKSTAFYVNASHCEGLCLPLLEFMSAGVPAIAPDHTAMADYIHRDNALVVSSSEEINIWPNDSSNRYTTRRYRNDWQGLCAAFEQSYLMINTDPAQYSRMATRAHEDMKAFCSLEAATKGLTDFLSRVDTSVTSAPTPMQTEEGH